MADEHSPSTKQNIFLKVVILALSWGAQKKRKLYACRKYWSLSVIYSIEKNFGTIENVTNRWAET